MRLCVEYLYEERNFLELLDGDVVWGPWLGPLGQDLRAPLNNLVANVDKHLMTGCLQLKKKKRKLTRPLLHNICCLFNRLLIWTNLAKKSKETQRENSNCNEKNGAKFFNWKTIFLMDITQACSLHFEKKKPCQISRKKPKIQGESKTKDTDPKNGKNRSCPIFRYSSELRYSSCQIKLFFLKKSWI